MSIIRTIAAKIIPVKEDANIPYPNTELAVKYPVTNQIKAGIIRIKKILLILVCALELHF
jgi:hypothetical protein